MVFKYKKTVENGHDVHHGYSEKYPVWATGKSKSELKTNLEKKVNEYFHYEMLCKQHVILEDERS